MKTIVLTGGGTAGHVVPNLALLPMLEKNFERIVYIGSENGIERDIISKYPNIEYYPITTVKLTRNLSPKNLLIPFKLYNGKKQAQQILKEVQPCVIFSKGGFVAVPVALASKKLKMYGKKRPIIARFDEYGNRLPDEIDLGTSQGITLKIVDPEKYGIFYFELKGIEFPRIEPTFEFEPSFIDEDDLPF